MRALPPPTPFSNLTIRLDLQNTGRLTFLHWEDKFDGPRHDPVWTSKCKGTCVSGMPSIITSNMHLHFAVKDVVMGTGTGPQKNAARDEAAGKALLALKAQDDAEAEAETAAE